MNIEKAILSQFGFRPLLVSRGIVEIVIFVLSGSKVSDPY